MVSKLVKIAFLVGGLSLISLNCGCSISREPWYFFPFNDIREKEERDKDNKSYPTIEDTIRKENSSSLYYQTRV